MIDESFLFEIQKMSRKSKHFDGGLSQNSAAKYFSRLKYTTTR